MFAIAAACFGSSDIALTSSTRERPTMRTETAFCTLTQAARLARYSISSRVGGGGGGSAAPNRAARQPSGRWSRGSSAESRERTERRENGRRPLGAGAEAGSSRPSSLATLAARVREVSTCISLSIVARSTLWPLNTSSMPEMRVFGTPMRTFAIAV